MTNNHAHKKNYKDKNRANAKKTKSETVIEKTENHYDIHKQKILELIDSIDNSHDDREIFTDFVKMAAITISNCVDRKHAPERENIYRDIASKYSDQDKQSLCQMLAEVVLGLDENKKQDLLGGIFMQLGIGNTRKGQYYTPSSVAQLTASLLLPEPDIVRQQIAETGYSSVEDESCGSGALLIALANRLLENNINYQPSVLFVARDIDQIAACMCYIQLSLLGCAGYVIVGDTLKSPIEYLDRYYLFPVDNDNVWYTPMYFSAAWADRQKWAYLDAMFRHLDHNGKMPPAETRKAKAA